MSRINRADHYAVGARSLDQAGRVGADKHDPEARARFLDNASVILLSTLDLDTTLANIAQLGVPRLGELSIVNLTTGAAARSVSFGKNFSSTLAAAESTAKVTVLGSADVVSDRRTVLHETSTRTELRVPLLNGAQVLGTLTFVRAAGCEFYADDVGLAEALAARASAAVFSAMLYRDAVRENAAKEQFLATMSHEFRTPLQSILGFTELLLLGAPVPIPDAARCHAERIAAASAHLLGLVNQQLDFARVSAQRTVLRVEVIDIAAFTEEVVLLIEPLAQAKGLHFHVSAPEAGLTVTTDVGKLRQICYNLLANAVKFTEQGHVTLTASIQQAQLVLQVRDSGIGIPPADLLHIFEPFYQVASTPRGARSGTGLGLSISNELAHRLGGQLLAASIVGEGTTFTLLLPLTPPDSAAD